MSLADWNLNGVLASFAGIAAVCATLAVPDSVWAYDANSTDKEVTNSCKDFSIDGSGVLSANCNEWDNDKVKSVEARTIDLDEKIGFKDGKLVYDQSNFSGECSDESVAVKSGKLSLSALCGEQTVGIGLSDRITNVGYGGTGGSPGLYWSSTVFTAAPGAATVDEATD